MVKEYSYRNHSQLTLNCWFSQIPKSISNVRNSKTKREIWDYTMTYMTTWKPTKLNITNSASLIKTILRDKSASRSPNMLETSWWQSSQPRQQFQDSLMNHWLILRSTNHSLNTPLRSRVNSSQRTTSRHPTTSNTSPLMRIPPLSVTSTKLTSMCSFTRSTQTPSATRHSLSESRHKTK